MDKLEYPKLGRAPCSRGSGEIVGAGGGGAWGRWLDVSPPRCSRPAMLGVRLEPPAVTFWNSPNLLLQSSGVPTGLVAGVARRPRQCAWQRVPKGSPPTRNEMPKASVARGTRAGKARKRAAPASSGQNVAPPALRGAAAGSVSGRRGRVHGPGTARGGVGGVRAARSSPLSPERQEVRACRCCRRSSPGRCPSATLLRSGPDTAGRVPGHDTRNVTLVHQA
ncbi:hypothetical protein DFJ74DRAFT_650594 [Hyaloraphidium curvatum]|nr:hypothetical protein DFJ74DRAFT_650594 [Hyaloraphidium curvatum]